MTTLLYWGSIVCWEVYLMLVTYWLWLSKAYLWYCHLLITYMYRTVSNCFPTLWWYNKLPFQLLPCISLQPTTSLHFIACSDLIGEPSNSWNSALLTSGTLHVLFRLPMCLHCCLLHSVQNSAPLPLFQWALLRPQQVAATPQQAVLYLVTRFKWYFQSVFLVFFWYTYFFCIQHYSSFRYTA